MGDHRAGTTGSTATQIPTGTPGGKRAARHAQELRTSQPYVGRRVAHVVTEPVVPPAAVALEAPTPARVSAPAPAPTPAPAPAPAPAPQTPYAGRRVAGGRHRIARVPARPAPEPVGVERTEPVGVERTEPVEADEGDEVGELEDVSAHLALPSELPTLPALAPTAPGPSSYVGRRVAPRLELVTLAEPAPEETVAVEKTMTVEKKVPVEARHVAEPVVEEPAAEVVEPSPAGPEPVVVAAAEAPAVAKARVAGRRAASRRTRVPSLPLLAGVAVLAISAGGALQAMNPGLAGAADGRISPASALSGSSGVGSGNVLGSRNASVSRDSDRQTLSAGSASSLRAAADAQAKERDASLSALAGRAEKRARDLKLHEWVLPVAPGAYHLTARFGDYSSLWSNFHTGLDFAAPTGTPIMAVASGVITDVGYSGAYGNRTIERLPDGTELWYCHQNDFGTAVGDKVRPGQVIGYVGSTGNVTGPHLHLEVHPGGGDPVDPYEALVVHGLYPGPPA